MSRRDRAGSNLPSVDTRRKAVAGVLGVLCAALMGAGTALAASPSWNTGSGTWDDTTTGNWNPAQVPVVGDSVTINRATATTVDFASGNFAVTNSNLYALTLGGTGASNTLQVGTGDTLCFSNSVNVNAGGRLELSGGTVADVNPAWHDGLKINNGGSVSITGGSFQLPQQCHVDLADLAGQTASLAVSGTGKLSPPTPVSGAGGDFNARNGNSTLTLADNGEITVWRNIFVGTVSGNHTWTISGGTLRSVLGDAPTTGLVLGGGTGTVTLAQTGGVLFTKYLNISTRATYNLSGGANTNGSVYVNGTLNQTNGVVYNNFDVFIGSAAAKTGTYTMVNGSFRSRGFNIAKVADSVGTFTMSVGTFTMVAGGGGSGVDDYFQIGATNGIGAGTLVLKGGTVGGNSSDGMRIYNTGTVRGYGTVNIGARPIVMRGKVVADGEGIDRTLNLSSFTIGVTNPVDNVSDKGWYATSHGKLVLPNVAVNAATTNIYNWGESQDDTTIDLVNSARFVFTGLSGSGSLTGSVVAVDSSVANPSGDRKISVHEFGLSGPSFTKCTLTIRYDGSVAPGLENKMVMARWTGANWAKVATTVDTTNHWITAADLTALGRFSLVVYTAGTRVSIQ